MPRALVLLALLLPIPLPALAQGPAADWRTVSTPHFRVHYPAASEAWARHAAARLESIRERVVAEVGYAPPEVVDVVVSDPAADANGMAFPFLGWPRMVLWTSPPGPESVIGHYRDWAELLIVHEEAHLVHMLRPSRNPARRLLSNLVPVGPITLGAPRWVFEGYATVVEGRLTGSGRPNGDLRASILRRWAQTGKLPSYGRLAADTESWLGMSMAYLMGSAYLEWLEERAGPGSLKNLWARMTARQGRSFDDAFRGVFGDSPADTYDRFRAELTWRAMEAERLRGPGVREGELWQDLAWTTGSPALAPDGRRMAIVLDARDKPARLVVWSTEPDEEAEKKWAERREKIRKEDPEDVPAVRNKPFPRKVLHTLPARDGIEPAMPRFLPDGKSILFVRFEPDAEGFLHPDLFVWTPETGDVRRVTRRADLRDPDPAPDGTWAVATRNRDGYSEIVRVDLATGEVQSLTEPTVAVTHDQPRVAPDGRRVAYARHAEGSWKLVILDLEGGRTVELSPPPGGTIAGPAWSADGRSVFAVVGSGGFIDLEAFPAEGGDPVPLTRTQGAAFSPEPSPDGASLFYVSLEPDGLDLRRLPLPTPADRAGNAPPAPTVLPPGLAPAVRPPEPALPEPFAVAEVGPGREYGLGRQELMPLLGGSASSDAGVWEVGVRGGDVIGRLDWLALGSISSDGWPEGGALAAVWRGWRGWPVDVGFHLFTSTERPTRDFAIPERGTLLDVDRRGLEVSALWDRRWSDGLLRVEARGLWGEVDPGRAPDVDHEIASLAAGYGSFRRWGSWRLDGGLGGRFEAGRTGGDGWTRFGGTARLALGHLGRDENRLALSWQRDGSEDVRYGFDLYQLGGPDVTLLPEAALSGRVTVPGLPVGTLLGSEHEGQRAELTLGLLPVPLFYERHRLWYEGEARGGWLSLAGLEYRFRLDPLPVGRLPGLDLRAGVARVLDEPFREEIFADDLRWWLIAVWRP